MSEAESMSSKEGVREDDCQHTFRGLGPARFVSLRLTRSTAIDLIDLPPQEVAGRLAALLQAPPAESGPVTLAFLNMRYFVASRRDPDAVQAFAAMDQVYPDGVGLQIARRLLGLRRYPRVSGTDTVPMLLERLTPLTRVYLLGGTPAISAAAQAGIARLFPLVTIVGAHHGFFQEAQDDSVVAAIAAAGPDLLLVGMGCPLQERWLARNRHRLPARLAICVGGLFHYWADDLRRAPRSMRDIGLEWLWILVQQPYKWRVFSIDAAYFGAALMRLKRPRSSS